MLRIAARGMQEKIPWGWTSPKTASVRTLPEVQPRVHEEDRTAAAIIGSHAGSARLTLLSFQNRSSAHKSDEQITARLSLNLKQITHAAAGVVAAAIAAVVAAVSSTVPTGAPRTSPSLSIAHLGFLHLLSLPLIGHS